MITKNNKYSLLIFFLWSCFASFSLEGQSNQLKDLRADANLEKLVNEELNKSRFLMMGREWWGLPTDAEEKRIMEGLYDRYTLDSLHDACNNLFRKRGLKYLETQKVLNSQNLIVMGWHMAGNYRAYNSYNFKLITHLSYYGYRVNPATGSYENIEEVINFKLSDIVQIAALDSCKVLLSVACLGKLDNEIFFSSEPFVKRTLIDSLKSILELTGANGVDLNFEQVPKEYELEFRDFIKDLSFELRETDPNYSIFLHVPTHDHEEVYHLSGLGTWVDAFIINSYNFHVEKEGLKEGPIAPLYSSKKEIRGTECTYVKNTNLLNLLSDPSQYRISKVELRLNREEAESVASQLDSYIKRLVRSDELKRIGYTKYDLGTVLEILRRFPFLQNRVRVRELLEKTECRAELIRDFPAEYETNFFLFRPNLDTLYVREYDIFRNSQLKIKTSQDPKNKDLASVIQHYKAQLGESQKTSLVVAFPYHGTVWYEKAFEGYIAYAQIRNLIKRGGIELYYDKTRNSMEGIITRDIIIRDTLEEPDKPNFVRIVVDTLYAGRRIYFDNSTSLDKKFDYVMEQGLGGVGIWALGYDHGYTELWANLEANFALRKTKDLATDGEKVFEIAKSNKIFYTINYNVKRNQRIIFITLFVISIIMALGFFISLTDWKVRDVLFYSGAFRIFYLTLFMVLVLSFSSYMGLFQSIMLTFLTGIFLGSFLTWLSTLLVRYQQSRLP